MEVIWLLRYCGVCTVLVDTVEGHPVVFWAHGTGPLSRHCQTPLYQCVCWPRSKALPGKERQRGGIWTLKAIPTSHEMQSSGSLWRLSGSRLILFYFSLNNYRICPTNMDACGCSHRDFTRLSHTFSHIDAFWLLAACGLPALELILHDLDECPGQGWWKASLLQRRSLCYPGCTLIITAVISPSKLCLTCVLEDRQNRKAYRQPEALGAPLPAARKQSGRLSLFH